MAARVRPQRNPKVDISLVEHCGACKYYLVRELGLHGECHAEPPAVVYHSASDELGTYWPATPSTDWCGHFTARA